MKVYSIRFQTIIHALKHQWKRILICILLFSLLGTGCGFLYKNKGMAQPGGSAKPLAAVDLSLLPRTRDYYSDCLKAIDSTLSNLRTYLKTVSANLPLNEDGQNTESQKNLDMLGAAAELLKSAQLHPLQSALGEAGAIYAPEEFLDGMFQRYTQELETVRMDLIAAEAATETVRQMDAPNYDGGFSSTYAELLYQASQYNSLLRRQAVYEKYLDNLQNHMPEIRTECRRVEQRLKEVAEDLNTLLDDFLELADGIAKEEGLTFTPSISDSDDSSKTMEILVTHAHRASSAQESFAVIVLFCVLVGGCVGVFLAVCQEAKEEKRRNAAQPGEAGSVE